MKENPLRELAKRNMQKNNPSEGSITVENAEEEDFKGLTLPNEIDAQPEQLISRPVQSDNSADEEILNFLNDKKEKNKKIKKPKIGSKKNKGSDSEGEGEEAAPKKKLDLRKLDLSKIDLKKIELSRKVPRLPLPTSVKINLTPMSHLNVIKERKAKSTIIKSFIGIFVACVVASGTVIGLNANTNSKLSVARDNNEAVQAEIAKYADVSQVLDSQEEAKRLLGKAASNEVNWQKLIDTVLESLPSGTTATAISVQSGGKSTDKVSTAINIELVSNSPMGYSDTLNAVNDINGVSLVNIGGLTSAGDNLYSYSMSFALDSSYLTKKYYSVKPKEAKNSDSSAGTNSSGVDDDSNPENKPDNPIQQAEIAKENGSDQTTGNGE